ncbi:ABC transporter ATP-binding protein [Magnetospirillum sp. UT-4]|uniref:ABC transporter ATP-binding protein n=1 Tax=Magnetospirillum sp. UT-4 TaxID=2681467 RepID=UPI0013854D7B|nr:ABC transporter ATP-binding protein [Magnetospirillum sp. UT-4]CAA7616852.1 putrescine transporter subunit: ATP-binding component of ABC superfamily [Magnetospirillum sp. UT-4]
MAAIAIRLEGIEKRFGDTEAVAGIDIEIAEGEFFSLLGPSGCGKTTLLRMLAGFESPSAGRVLIGGADVTDVPPYERPVNMMFQSYALFPHMSVADNVAFGLKQDGVPRPEIRERVAAALDLVQMGDFAGRRPHQLSGGQRQRVALARSLVKRPKVLLLDEPLSALDKKLREQTQFELVNIQEKVGVTFVMVTHDQEEAMTMSTRIAVMDKGRVLQVGTPHEIYEYPANRVVADFIGIANFFDGRVAAGADGVLEIRVPGIEAPLAVAGTAEIGGMVTVMVRPEKIAMSRDDGTAPPGALTGRVVEIAYLGDVSIYHVRLPSGAVAMVTAANLRHSSEPAITWDDAVALTWHPGNAVVLR